MKKTLLLFKFFLLSIGFLQAQWTTVGSDIHYSTGKVGIGTVPSVKLDINSPDNDGATKLRLANTTSTGTNAPGSFPVIEVLGARGDGNTTFEGRLALGMRRTSGTALSNQTLGAVLFGGQHGTDMTFQASKMLYPASIQGIAEGSFTNAATMPTGIAFFTGSTGDDAGSGNLSYGSERMRITNYGTVGLGTSTPDQLLTLNAPNGANSLVSFKQSATTKVYVGLGMDGVFRNQTLNNTELQLRADGALNFISLYTNSSEKMRVTDAGNIGIGTNGPRSKLDVWAGDLFVTGNDGNGTAFITSHAGVAYYGNDTYSNGLAIAPNGNVGVGTASPGTYKLAVEGTLGARKVKVTQTPWADYVFERDYHLPSLKEVEEFIQCYKHLPEVPSVKEVETNGLDLGDNQALLLKKIEELTLYIIQQQKEIETLKAENKSVEQLKARLDLIEKSLRNQN